MGDNSVGPSAFLVNSPVVIDGPSGNSGIALAVAGTTMRLFDVTSTGNLTLQDLTLSGGSAQGFAGGNSTQGGAGGGSAGLGGAIFNQGTLTILDSTLTGNTAQGGGGGSYQAGLGGYISYGSYGGRPGAGGAGGGGLAEDGGPESGNPGSAGGGPLGGAGGGFTSGGYGGFGGGGGGGYGDNRNVGGFTGGDGGFGGGGGGGGYSFGFGGDGGFGGGGGGGGGHGSAGGAGGYGGGGGGSVYSAGGGGGGAGMGGAVFNEAGTVVITNSTFAGNTASGGTGGAGFHNNSGGAGQGLGGGLFNHNGTITVTNSTFSGNTAAQGGRGIFNVGDSYLGASANINNTIIGQSDTNVSDFQDARTNGGATGVGGAGNLIRTITGVTNFTGTLTGDPLLGSLQDHGGPTQTMALLAGSPAINAGSNPLVAGNTDQRGEMRIVSGTVDIGAFELQPGESIAVPTFSGLSVAYDMGSTKVVVAGHIGAGAIFPTGSTVSITVNSVTKTATVDDAGNFSTTFDTTSLGGPDSPLTVSFEFNGSDGFSDVTVNPQTITFGPLAEKTYGDADFVLGATASSGLPVSFTATGDANVYQGAGEMWFVHIIAPEAPPSRLIRPATRSSIPRLRFHGS